MTELQCEAFFVFVDRFQISATHVSFLSRYCSTNRTEDEVPTIEYEYRLPGRFEQEYPLVGKGVARPVLALCLIMALDQMFISLGLLLRDDKLGEC